MTTSEHADRTPPTDLDYASLRSQADAYSMLLGHEFFAGVIHEVDGSLIDAMLARLTAALASTPSPAQPTSVNLFRDLGYDDTDPDVIEARALANSEASEREALADRLQDASLVVEGTDTGDFWGSIADAIRAAGFGLAPSPVQGAKPGHCDNCGAPQTRVTTPGGFRSCDDCFGGKR